MSEGDPDPLLAQLRALPEARLDDVAVERVRKRARVALEREGAARRWAVRAVAAAVVASTVAVYLALLVNACASLYG